MYSLSELEILDVECGLSYICKTREFFTEITMDKEKKGYDPGLLDGLMAYTKTAKTEGIVGMMGMNSVWTLPYVE